MLLVTLALVTGAATWDQTLTTEGGKNYTRDQALVREIIALVKTEPAKAADLAAVIEDREIRLNAYAAIANEWVKVRPDEAAAWALSEDTPERPDKVPSVLWAWVRVDPKRAAAWAESLDRNQAYRYNACASAAQVWFAADPAACRAWVRSIEDAIPRMQASAVIGWTEPELRVEEERAGTTADAMTRAVILDSLTRAWALKDPAKAEALARSIEDRQARSNALFYLAVTWPEKELHRAEALARSLDDQNRRTAALVSIVGTCVDAGRFADASRIAQSIESRGPRSERMRYVLMSYYRRDPKAAKAWLQTLPSAVRADLGVALRELENPARHLQEPSPAGASAIQAGGMSGD